MKWEYLEERIPFKSWSLNCNKLKSLGAKGWELVQIVPLGTVGPGTHGLFFFKRQLT